MENQPPAYSHRARPFTPELELRLDERALRAERGRSAQTYSLDRLEGIRLSYAPQSLARLAFTCTVRAADGNSVRFGNLSWRSLVALDRQDGEYRAFVAGLVARARQANPAVRLEAGLPPLRYRLMQALGLALVAGLVGSALRFALLPLPYHAALALFAALYLGFWLHEFLGRNRPRAFAAGSIPPEVLPEKPA